MSEPQKTSDLFRERIAASRARFLSTIERRIGEPRELAVADPSTTDPIRGEPRSRTLHRMIHELCGSAGMLGLHDMDAEGRVALAIVEAADAETRSLTPSEQVEVNRHLDRMMEMAMRHKAAESAQ